jgi:hypothetical protein
MMVGRLDRVGFELLEKYVDSLRIVFGSLRDLAGPLGFVV